MNNCWEVLGIHPTANEEVIKSAYRQLIKRYHPDTVRAPEKVRRYTIRCVEIIDAYRGAIKYAKTHKDESAEMGSEEQLVSSAQYATKKKNFVIRIFDRIEMPFLYIFGILFVLEYVFGIPSLTVIFKSFEEGVKSLPYDNILKMILFAFFAIIAGVVCSFTLYVPLVGPFGFIWSNIVNTKYEKYAYKAGFLVMITIYIYIAYFTSLFSHAPFNKYHSLFYNSLSEIFRLVFCFTAPLFLFGQWLRDKIKYARVKNNFNTSDLFRIE